ncbi:hypothetical protein CDEST_02387 [Colletotrichum destructivum]|uniref:Uncharacterized protein n=1 Tax=Colletotrichum destructivum TaxID=34406 RepID=A0AAX4I1X6_9PEZI|nr:hypothetical protein CDEST_02387 [Colletotrichum destructivum]
MEVDELPKSRLELDGKSKDSPVSISAPREEMSNKPSLYENANAPFSFREQRLWQTVSARNKKIRELEKRLRQDIPSADPRANSSTTMDREAMMRHLAVIESLAEENAQLKHRVRQLEAHGEEKAELQNSLAEASKVADMNEERRAKDEKNYQEIVKKLEGRIGELTNHTQSLGQQLVSLKAHNTGNRTLANDGKVSDDEIRSLWQQMAFNIQNIVANFLTGRPRPTQEELRHEHSTTGSCVVCQLTPEGLSLLWNEDMRDSVLEGMIWVAICGYTFENVRQDNRVTIWGGGIGKIFSRLYRILFVAVKRAGTDPAAVLRWKSESARLIDSIMGASEESMQSAVRDEFTGLSRFLPSNNEDLVSDFFKELNIVFEDAVHLHAIFMKSRALFYIDWAIKHTSPDSGLLYDPERHNAEAWVQDLSNKSIVLFSISPGLIKMGNADGDSYDKRIRLAKSSVVCN